MATLIDTSAEGKLVAKYLDDRRGVLMRARFTESVLNVWDHEPFGTPVTYPSGGVFPKIRASNGAITSTGTSTSLVVPLPSGWQAGDLCYISWAILSTGATITLPSGWTAIVPGTLANGVTNTLHGVAKRILQAGDGSPTFTFPSGKMTAVSTAIYDFDLAVNEDVTPVTDTNSGVTAPSVRAPSITPVTNGALLITNHAARNGTSGVTNMTFSTPTGMTEIREKYSALSSATNIGIAVDSLQLSGLTPTGNKTSTVSGSNVTSLNQVGSSILVRPKTPPPSGLAISGGFAWKNTTMLGPHTLIYDAPGSSSPEVQWCGTIFKSNGTPITVDSSLASVYGGVDLPALLPTVRASAEVSSGSSAGTTSTTVPLPPGWQVDDLCYIYWALATTSGTFTPPAGWTELIPNIGSTGTMHGVIKRILQAGDANPVLTHTSARSSAVSVAIYNYDPTTQEDVTPVTTSGAGATPLVNANSITPVTANCLLLTSHMVRNTTNNIINMAYAPPSGMTEVEDIATSSTVANSALEVCRLALTTTSPTGTKSATLSGSDITTISGMSSSIVVRPKAQGVTGVTGVATTYPFNAPSSPNMTIVAMASYNGAATDAVGDHVTITNNKGLSVTKIVERGHREDVGMRGGTAIAYMYASGAQTNMTVTATLSGIDTSFDDLVLQVILLTNVDNAAGFIPDGVVEGSREITTNNPVFKINAVTITQGLAVWACNDALNLGPPNLTDAPWIAVYGTVAKTATSPISGQNSLLNTWTTNQLGIRNTFVTQMYISGPKLIRFNFKILGTEAQSSSWPKNQKARLEVKFYNGTVVIGTCITGFPSNILRSWYVDYFIPNGQKVTKIEIIGFGWDSSAAARFDEFMITEKTPPYVQFVRQTDGGYIRGGDPAQAVQGVAYAFDDELVFGQDTYWYAEPVYPNGNIGTATGTVHFVIEDRAVSLPSTLIKSVETPGLKLYLATDQREISRSRETTFVNKQGGKNRPGEHSGSKPSGGVNSVFSASGDYMLITQTIPEMNDLMSILDETVLYISPTGRYHRAPFFATAKEYTITDFATMDSEYKIFSVNFQEVERPDTAWQPSFLPLHDYDWLSTQYPNYGSSQLIVQTYDELAFGSVT